MKYQSLSSPLVAAAFVCVLALSVTNCSSDTKTAGVGGKSGTAGQAGDNGGDAGNGPILVCGKVAALSQCDPVTAAPCNIVDGETCDYDPPSGGFLCFPGPNSAGPGDACGKDAAFCGASTTCNGDLHQCEHYCCADSDCEHGLCKPNIFADGDAVVGACYGEFAALNQGSSGAGGEGGAR